MTPSGSAPAATRMTAARARTTPTSRPTRMGSRSTWGTVDTLQAIDGSNNVEARERGPAASSIQNVTGRRAGRPGSPATGSRTRSPAAAAPTRSTAPATTTPSTATPATTSSRVVPGTTRSTAATATTRSPATPAATRSTAAPARNGELRRGGVGRERQPPREHRVGGRRRRLRHAVRDPERDRSLDRRQPASGRCRQQRPRRRRRGRRHGLLLGRSERRERRPRRGNRDRRWERHAHRRLRSRNRLLVRRHADRSTQRQHAERRRRQRHAQRRRRQRHPERR